jgi:hypothetical protein
MKRFGTIFIVLLVTIGLPLFADTAVLLDFSTLAADTDGGQNEATLMDFSGEALIGFTPEEKSAMKTSLAVDNWDVELASSSKTVANMRLSMTKAVTVKDSARQFGGETVMGVRVHFPEEAYNSYAMVVPPFEIPAYMRKTTLQSDGTLVEDETDSAGTKFDGYGVLKNVGVLKSISVNIYGSNFPNGFGLVLMDQNNKEQIIFMNYLDFDGWRQLTWENPNYIDDARNRQLVRYPLYPRAEPMIKLIGLVFYKDAAQEGGDFIAYVKDITVTYDKAILDTQRDFDDESVWGILSAREDQRRKFEFSRMGNIQVLRYLESKKMDQGDNQQ